MPAGTKEQGTEITNNKAPMFHGMVSQREIRVARDKKAWCPVHWLVGWLAGRLVGCLFGCLVGMFQKTMSNTHHFRSSRRKKARMEPRSPGWWMSMIPRWQL